MSSSNVPRSDSAKSPRSPSDRTSRRPAPVAGPISSTRKIPLARPPVPEAEDYEDDRSGELALGRWDARHPPSDSSRHIPGPMQQRTASTSNNPVPPSSYPNQLRSAPGTVGFNSTPFQDPYQFPQVQPIPVGYNSPLQDPRQNPAAANIATRVAVANNLYPTPANNTTVPRNAAQVYRSTSESSTPNPRPPAPVSRVSSSSTSRTEGRDRNHTVEYYKLVPVSANDVHEQSASSYHQSNPQSAPSGLYPAQERYDYGRPTAHASTSGETPSKRSNSEIVQPMASASSRLPSTSRTESAQGHQWGRSEDLTPYTVLSSNQMNTNSYSSTSVGPQFQGQGTLFSHATKVSLIDTTINVIGGNMTTHAPYFRDNEGYADILNEQQVGFALPSAHPSVEVQPRSRQQETASDEVPPLKPLEPFGYPSLTVWQFKNRAELQRSLKPDIQDHIPAYMALRLFDRSETIIPLWNADPLVTPPNGQIRGLEIGDFVYLDESGRINLIFNVFRSFESNLEDGCNPPPKAFYEGVQTTFRSGAHSRHRHLQEEKYYLSNNVVRLMTQESQNNARAYRFQAKKGSRNEGIIILPHGARHSLINDTFFSSNKVKEHFLKYSPSWYRHARTIHPGLTNGSLFLVAETYCAKTWAIAALSSKKPINSPAPIEFCQNSGNQYVFKWVPLDNRWISNNGPSRLEIENLADPPITHCVGAIFYSLSLDDRTWRKHFEPKPEHDRQEDSPSANSKATSSSATASSATSPLRSVGSTWAKFWRRGTSDQGRSVEDKDDKDQSSSELGYTAYTLLKNNQE